MKKHPAAARLLALVLFAAVGLCLGLPAYSQDSAETVLNIEPYKPLSRPVARFDHDAHQDILEDCASCHHGKNAEGKRDPDDYDPSESCDSCHKPAGKAEKGTTPLKRAYHKQCISCHVAENTGPTYCAGCHQSS